MNKQNFKIGYEVVLNNGCDNVELLNIDGVYIIDDISANYPLIKIKGVTKFWYYYRIFNNDIKNIRRNKLKQLSNHE